MRVYAIVALALETAAVSFLIAGRHTGNIEFTFASVVFSAMAVAMIAGGKMGVAECRQRIDEHLRDS
jgi:hypothetical protein